jgi:uncharacterized membrane protein
MPTTDNHRVQVKSRRRTVTAHTKPTHVYKSDKILSVCTVQSFAVLFAAVLFTAVLFALVAFDLEANRLVFPRY